MWVRDCEGTSVPDRRRCDARCRGCGVEVGWREGVCADYAHVDFTHARHLAQREQGAGANAVVGTVRCAPETAEVAKAKREGYSGYRGGLRSYQVEDPVVAFAGLSSRSSRRGMRWNRSTSCPASHVRVGLGTLGTPAHSIYATLGHLPLGPLSSEAFLYHLPSRFLPG